MKKKIMIIVDSLSGGGAEHVARKNLQCIAQSGQFAPSLLTCNIEAVAVCPVDTCYVSSFNQSSSMAQRALRSLYMPKNKEKTAAFLRRQQPDIIHFHNYLTFSPSTMEAVFAYKRETKCRVVMTHHSFSYVCTNDALFNYTKNCRCDVCLGLYNNQILLDNCAGSRLISTGKYLQKNVMKQYRNLVDVHISPSTFLKEQLQRAFPSMDVLQLYNPCIESVPEISESDREKEVIYFGRINREKNILPFAKLFAQAKSDYTLRIIGDGPQAGELEELLSGLGCMRISFYRGFLPAEELFPKIRKAQYYVLPSIWYENSPVAIIEAIAFGTVPIVSDIGGMKELCDLFACGIRLDPDSPSCILERIRGLALAYPAAYEKTIAHRDRLDNFLVSDYSKHILSIYSQL